MRRPAILESNPLYPPEILLYTLLNPLKKRSNQLLLGFLSCGERRIMAQSAGVSVKALIPEMTIAAAKVSENCL